MGLFKRQVAASITLGPNNFLYFKTIDSKVLSRLLESLKTLNPCWRSELIMSRDKASTAPYFYHFPSVYCYMLIGFLVDIYCFKFIFIKWLIFHYYPF